ncbi:hypothetical protein PSPO01_16292 [Paraphaeosphaeria sporulosa]
MLERRPNPTSPLSTSRNLEEAPRPLPISLLHAHHYEQYYLICVHANIHAGVLSTSETTAGTACYDRTPEREAIEIATRCGRRDATGEEVTEDSEDNYGGAEADAKDVEDTNVVDAVDAESNAESTASRQSRSPTRRVVDLRIARKPLVPRVVKSSEDVPEDVRALYKAISTLVRRSKGVIPQGIEKDVGEDAHGDLDEDLEFHTATKPTSQTREQLVDEFKSLRNIRDETATCKEKKLHEPSWNALVHGPMLKQAVRDRPGFSYYDITTARVMKELVPDNEYGELLKGKTIDFVVTLSELLIPKAPIVKRLNAAPRKLSATCNASAYSPLCYEPVVLSIETKSPEGSTETAEVQLTVWAMAHFNRLRKLIRDPVDVTLPLLLVAGAQWRLYFASDSDDRIELINAVGLGGTEDLLGCYTVLMALRLVVTWVEGSFKPWFLEGLEPE